MLLEYNRVLDFDSILATEDGMAIGAVSRNLLLLTVNSGLSVRLQWIT